MKKSTYAFAAIAILMVLLTAFRIDQKLAGKSIKVQQIEKKANAFVKDMKSARKAFDKFAVERNVDEWRLRDKPDDKVVTIQTITILITGFMQSGDGEFMATMDGGTVLKRGDVYKGFHVIRVTNKGVNFNINGQMQFIKVGEAFEAAPLDFRNDSLVLDAIVKKGGVHVAVFGRESYKAGDWIDGATQVKVIAPNLVMLDINGKNKMLKVGQPLIGD